MIMGTDRPQCAWWPRADKSAGSRFEHAKRTRRARHGDMPWQSNHRHADFQFAYKTLSCGNLREFWQTPTVSKITENVLPNKRLDTLGHFGEISVLYLYCTFRLREIDRPAASNAHFRMRRFDSDVVYYNLSYCLPDGTRTFCTCPLRQVFIHPSLLLDSLHYAA